MKDIEREMTLEKPCCKCGIVKPASDYCVNRTHKPHWGERKLNEI